MFMILSHLWILGGAESILNGEIALNKGIPSNICVVFDAYEYSRKYVRGSSHRLREPYVVEGSSMCKSGALFSRLQFQRVVSTIVAAVYLQVYDDSLCSIHSCDSPTSDSTGHDLSQK